MRERYLEVFDKLWIDCLNGDKYRTGKLTPEGEPDPSIFSTEHNREGIQVGTAIAVFVRRAEHGGGGEVRFRNLWGAKKRRVLEDTKRQDGKSLYHLLSPALELGLPLMPAEVASGYVSWPLLTELFPVSFPGVKTSRDNALVDIDRDRLIRRMERYFDDRVSAFGHRIFRSGIDDRHEHVQCKGDTHGAYGPRVPRAERGQILLPSI